MIGIRANDGTLVNADFIQEYRIFPQPNGEKYQLEAIFGRKADNELDSTPLVIGTQQECLLELDYLSDRKGFSEPRRFRFLFNPFNPRFRQMRLCVPFFLILKILKSASSHPATPKG